jgi:hypothetical protein
METLEPTRLFQRLADRRASQQKNSSRIRLPI